MDLKYRGTSWNDALVDGVVGIGELASWFVPVELAGKIGKPTVKVAGVAEFSKSAAKTRFARNLSSAYSSKKVAAASTSRASVSKIPTRLDVISETEMVQKAASVPGERKGLFKCPKVVGSFDWNRVFAQCILKLDVI